MTDEDLSAVRRLDGSALRVEGTFDRHGGSRERTASCDGGGAGTQRARARIPSPGGTGNKTIERALALDQTAADGRHDHGVIASDQMRPTGGVYHPAVD